MARSSVPYLATDHEYVQRVRRHPPSSLLPLIAEAGALFWSPDTWENDPSCRYRPWALADAARVSLTHGNEHRGMSATRADLDEILGYYLALDEPMRHSPPGQRLEPFLLRVSGQQFTWQRSSFGELTRTLALLEHTKPARPLKVIAEGWDHDLLGCSLTDYVGIAQLLYGSASTQRGRFDPLWLNGPDREAFERIISRDVLTRVVHAHFATTAAELRTAEAARARPGGDHPLLRRYTYNPLHGRPLVNGYGSGYLAPVTGMLIEKASPLGLYYTGVERHGNAFAEDLGELFEQYVGRQLDLLPDAEVHAEVTYTQGGSERRGVDWTVVFCDLVLLVEVKSTRPTETLRLGVADYAKELKKRVGRALEQIDTSADLIAQRHPAFVHIPGDRPVLGVVVTMEPFHMINAPGFRTVLPATRTSVTVTSISDLENAVCVSDAHLADLLLAGSTAGGERWWSVRECAGGHTLGDNPVLNAAWDAYPWSHTG